MEGNPSQCQSEVSKETQKLSVQRGKAFIFLGILLLGGCLIFLVPVRELVEVVVVWNQSLGVWGVFLLGLIYACATIMMLPCWPLGMLAGFLFDVPLGLLVVSLASTFGATLACLLGRTLARSWVTNTLTRYPAFARLDSAVAERGFRMVLLSRLALIIPYNLLNYALGLTKVRMRDYILATWLGMLPGSLMFVSLGAALKSVNEITSNEPINNPYRLPMIVVGLLASLITVIWFGRLAKDAFSKNIDG